MSLLTHHITSEDCDRVGAACDLARIAGKVLIIFCAVILLSQPIAYLFSLLN